MYFLPSQYPEVIKAMAKFQAEGQVTDPKAAIISSFANSPAAAMELVIMSVFYQDPVDTIPAVLQDFFDIGPVLNTAGIKTLAQHAADVYGPAGEIPPMR